MTTKERAELAAAIDKALLRGLVILRPGRNVPIRSAAELLAIEPENGGYYLDFQDFGGGEQEVQIEKN